MGYIREGAEDTVSLGSAHTGTSLAVRTGMESAISQQERAIWSESGGIDRFSSRRPRPILQAAGKSNAKPDPIYRFCHAFTMVWGTIPCPVVQVCAANDHIWSQIDNVERPTHPLHSLTCAFQWRAAQKHWGGLSCWGHSFNEGTLCARLVRE